MDEKTFDCLECQFKAGSKECEICYEYLEWESMTDEDRYARELINGDGSLDEFGYFHYYKYYDDE